MRFLADDFASDRSAKPPQMLVIGAGLPRCATSSLQAALESPAMGYSPCMHMAHVVPHVSRAQTILDAMQEDDAPKRQKLLRTVFDGCRATADFPGFWFVDDLMDMYPDAALVLNQRKGGGASWKKSFDGSIAFFASWPYYLACFPFKTDRLHWNIHQVANRNWKKRWGDGDLDSFYDIYQSYVLAEAKKRGREVLVWKADDGWEPLCRFLGKHVPKNEPFPWVNDAATMTLLKRILVARGILAWLAIFGGAYAAWAYGPHLLQRAGLGIGKML